MLCRDDYVSIRSNYKVNYSKDLISPVPCITIDLHQIFVGQNKRISRALYLTTKANIVKQTGYTVGVDNFERESLHTIKRGHYIIQITNVNNISRLRAPFKSNCTEEESDLNIFPAPYTRRKCRNTLMFIKMLEECGDVPDHWRGFVKPQHKKGWKFKYRNVAVNRSDAYIRFCISNIYIHYGDPDLSSCPLPCKEIEFESKIITKRVLATKESSRKPSIFHVQFQSRRVTDITEVPVYTSDDFFSDVGSWLGLLVGMSCLSIVEVVTFVFIAVLEKCM